jgi:hypothetical protein
LQGSFNLIGAVITSTITIFAGIIIFIVSQFLLKLFIEPVSEYRKLLSRVTYYLTYYSNSYSNPLDMKHINENNEQTAKYKEESIKLREIAGEVISGSQIVPFYRVASFFGIIPKREDISDISLNSTFAP